MLHNDPEQWPCTLQGLAEVVIVGEGQQVTIPRVGVGQHEGSVGQSVQVLNQLPEVLKPLILFSVHAEPPELCIKLTREREGGREGYRGMRQMRYFKYIFFYEGENYFTTLLLL